MDQQMLPQKHLMRNLWLNILIQQLDTGMVERHYRYQALRDHNPHQNCTNISPYSWVTSSYHSCKRHRSGHWLQNQDEMPYP
uniref:Uncharacterized protein n=1 Tax=Arundo donax TaxID=35708 RepID=A0A0A9H892_ARUDO